MEDDHANAINKMDSTCSTVAQLSALECKQREAFFLQATNNRLLSLQAYQLLITGVMIVIAAISLTLVVSKPIKNNYFLVDENGRVINKISPFSDPLVASQKVRTFADDCVRMVLNIDFVHYRTQLSNAEQCFTRRGYLRIVNLLKDRGILAELSDGYNIGSVVPNQANFIRSRSGDEGKQKWLVKGDYLWSLKRGKNTTQYPLTVEAMIIEVGMTDSIYGLAIDSLVIRKR